VGDDTVELDLYRGKKVKKEKGVEVNTNFNFPGSEILKVGSEYTLIKISDKGVLGSKAASYFGGYGKGVDRGETTWCTGSENSIHSHGYRQKGPLYILIANDDKGKVGEFTGLPSDRYQLHFDSNQFKNPNQSGGNIPIVEYLNGKWSEFKDIFKPEFAAGFVKPNSDNVEIKYPDSATGKFVALYGFDELFTSLPDTIKRLNIINTSTEEVTIEVPDSISRFQSLTAILFENMISELPNSICDLKNLVFLALPNNRELKSIPECVNLVNLPKLTFMNVNKCPNLTIPKELEQYHTGGGFYHMEE
jgi:Leucine-rich repeat (LRR) protein